MYKVEEEREKAPRQVNAKNTPLIWRTRSESLEKARRFMNVDLWRNFKEWFNTPEKIRPDSLKESKYTSKTTM